LGQALSRGHLNGRLANGGGTGAGSVYHKLDLRQPCRNCGTKKPGITQL
jgi:hypothetical protein